MAECLTLLENLKLSITNANTQLIINMTNPDKEFSRICVIPQTHYDTYYNKIKTEWEKLINDFINIPNKCTTNIQGLLFLYEILNESKIDLSVDDIKKLLNGSFEVITPEIKEKLITSGMKIINNKGETNFIMTEYVIQSLKNLVKILVEQCKCQAIDILTFILTKYKNKLSIIYENIPQEDIIKIFKEKYILIKSYINKFILKNQTGGGFVRNELTQLLPDTLGTMKEFFIRVLEKYLDNLHPIIWVQMFVGVLNNIFVDLPFTFDEFIAFISKCILLNSGPFILKLLQMIRPILPNEILKKYNISKLTYPLMEKEQIEHILNKVLDLDKKNNFALENKSNTTFDLRYKLLNNFSASVGHVCLLYDTHTETNIIIKIVKPLSIAQTCWESYIFKDLFKKDSCDDKFIKNMISAIQEEMNVEGEIKNLELANKYYDSNYNNEFNINLNATLSTVKNIKGIIKDGVWFALSMTLADGVPVSKLVENNLIEKDEYLKNNLYRCFDILVSRFFYVWVNHGFFHGDLHSGNMFYDVKTNKLTLIDFGAVGHLDLLNGSTELINIIIKAVYSNFDEMFDLLTDILNNKCVNDGGSMIDKQNEKYKTIRKTFTNAKIRNTINSKKDKANKEKIINNLMNPTRIKKEQMTGGKIEEGESISFEKIMADIGLFYASNGVNIAVKFAELNEIQKAYGLLLGTLISTGYDLNRFTYAVEKGINNWSTYYTGLLHPKTGINVLVTLLKEEKNQRKLLNKIYKVEKIIINKN